MPTMNKTQKRALQIHGPDMVRDLDLTADLTAKFIHHGIFNEDMIEEMKSIRTRKEQIQDMLLRLPRRGPRAFEKFIHSIQDHYHWLADDLRKTHHELSLKKGSETITMKEMVDMIVHEKFGQSKRFSEEDKKEIRKFLYKQLKSHADECLHYDINSRRNSIQSDVSDFNQQREEQVDINKNENILLKQLYDILNEHIDSESDDDSNDEEITVEMIESKAHELNRKNEDLQNEIKDCYSKIEDLQNEMKDCYSVLGLKDCKYSLHEVLETYKEKNQMQVSEIAKFQERVEKLKKQRGKLENALEAKEKELQKYMNNLANEEHENERSKVKIDELRSECARLNNIQTKHMETHHTLKTLKSMVKDLKPIVRESNEQFSPQYGFDEVDGGTLHLPKLSKPLASRSSRVLRRSTVRDSTHHDYPQPKPFGSSSPWKY